MTVFDGDDVNDAWAHDDGTTAPLSVSGAGTCTPPPEQNPEPKESE